jgi:hypothetical protein
MLHAMFRARDSNYSNESAPYIAEFFARQRLAKLGFTSPLDELDSVTAEVFIVIDAEIEKIKGEEMKKASRKR